MRVDAQQQYLELQKTKAKMTELMLIINRRYVEGYNRQAETPVRTSLRLAYRMSSECFLSITAMIGPGLYLSSASLARIIMEVLADMYHIHTGKSKQKERAKLYVDSVNVYFDRMIESARDLLDGKEIQLQHINPWTSSNIDSRVTALGANSKNVYDFLSTFTHANPGYYAYLSEKKLLDVLQVAILRAAIVHMLSIIKIMASNGVEIDVSKLAAIEEELTNL